MPLAAWWSSPAKGQHPRQAGEIPVGVELIPRPEPTGDAGRDARGIDIERAGSGENSGSEILESRVGDGALDCT